MLEARLWRQLGAQFEDWGESDGCIGRPGQASAFDLPDWLPGLSTLG